MHEREQAAADVVVQITGDALTLVLRATLVRLALAERVLDEVEERPSRAVLDGREQPCPSVREREARRRRACDARDEQREAVIDDRHRRNVTRCVADLQRAEDVLEHRPPLQRDLLRARPAETNLQDPRQHA